MLTSITPVFKKNAPTSKNNYRPVRFWPVISRILKRLICNQLPAFFRNIFSKSQFGFRKPYSMQYYLLIMLEAWKEAVD